MPEVDDERAEVIKYGLELIIGELPKMFLLFVIAWLFGIFKYALISFAIILPYKLVSFFLNIGTFSVSAGAYNDIIIIENISIIAEKII